MDGEARIVAIEAAAGVDPALALLLLSRL